MENVKYFYIFLLFYLCALQANEKVLRWHTVKVPGYFWCDIIITNRSSFSWPATTVIITPKGKALVTKKVNQLPQDSNIKFSNVCSTNINQFTIQIVNSMGKRKQNFYAEVIDYEQLNAYLWRAYEREDAARVTVESLEKLSQSLDENHLDTVATIYAWKGNTREAKYFAKKGTAETARRVELLLQNLQPYQVEKTLLKEHNKKIRKYILGVWNWKKQELGEGTITYLADGYCHSKGIIWEKKVEISGTWKIQDKGILYTIKSSNDPKTLSVGKSDFALVKSISSQKKVCQGQFIEIAYTKLKKLEKIACSRCKKSIIEGANFCPYCKALPKPGCLKCNAIYSSNEKFCVRCGAKFRSK